MASTDSIFRVQDDLISRSEAVQQALKSQTASLRTAKPRTSLSFLEEEKERGALLATIEDLRRKFDALQRKEQTWDEVVDPVSGNVYFKDRYSGETAGKYLNAVPGSTSFGYASLGIALQRRQTPRDGTGPIVVKHVLESSPVFGLVLACDRLMTINREDVTQLKLSVVHALLNGHAGSKVLLGFSRPPEDFRHDKFWDTAASLEARAMYTEGGTIRHPIEDVEVEATRSNAVPLSEELDLDEAHLPPGPLPPASAPAQSSPASWIKTLRSTPKDAGNSAVFTGAMASLSSSTFGGGATSGSATFGGGATSTPVKGASGMGGMKVGAFTPGVNLVGKMVDVGEEEEEEEEAGPVGLLEIDVQQASNLPHGAWERSYVALTLGQALDESLSAGALAARGGEVEQVSFDAAGAAQVARTQFNHASRLPAFSFADPLCIQVRRRCADGTDELVGQVAFPRCAEFVAERGTQEGWYALEDCGPAVEHGNKARSLLHVSIVFTPANKSVPHTLQIGQRGGLYSLPKHPDAIPPMVSLTEFIEADREGEAALVVRFDAFKDRLPRPRQGEAFRAFSAALAVKLRVAHAEESETATRADMALLDRRVQLLDQQVHERELDIVQLRASQSHLSRNTVASDGESHKLAVMYTREVQMRRAAEERASELATLLQQSKVAERAARHDHVEANGVVARLQEQLRNNPFESAFEKLVDQWNSHKVVASEANAHLDEQLREQDASLQATIQGFDELLRRFQKVEHGMKEALLQFVEEPRLKIEGETHRALREYLKHLRESAVLYKDHVRDTRELRLRVNQRMMAAGDGGAHGVTRGSGGQGGVAPGPVPEIEQELVTTKELLAEKCTDLMLVTEALRGAMNTHVQAEEMVLFHDARKPELRKTMELLGEDLAGHMHVATEASQGMIRAQQDILSAVMNYAAASNRAIETHDRRIANLLQKLRETRWVKDKQAQPARPP